MAGRTKMARKRINQSTGAGANKKRRANNPLIVVGIGASAGGLEAFKRLLEHLQDDTGMAFILIQHLDPTYKTSLPQILSGTTEMPILEVRDGMRLQPNTIYVMPSNAVMTMTAKTLRLGGRSPTRPNLPIDLFFHSLAEQQKQNAIGVILSGTGTDGAIGLKAIKAEGGITFAQDETSAKYTGMPKSAADLGGIDFVLPPEDIAAELIKIGQHRPKMQHKIKPPERGAVGKEDVFNKIYTLLEKASGVDFGKYKLSTIERRIARRMMINKVGDLSQYLELLRKSKLEIDALYHDIFIHVTRFFREPEKYEILKSKVFPGLFRTRPLNDPIRIWVPGCSSGEEVYSLVIVLTEYLSKRSLLYDFTIFATDISNAEILKARAGVYAESIADDVTERRLNNFFNKVDDKYEISRSLRDHCIFAKHDMTSEAPFSRMDLISCCNVLMYLQPSIQKQVLSTLHYSLKSSGYLLLGKSESTTLTPNLFEPVDKAARVFSKNPVPSVAPTFATFPSFPLAGRLNSSEQKMSRAFDFQREADLLVMKKYKHVGFLVDRDLKILAFRGNIGPFLDPDGPYASLDLSSMVRKELRLDCRLLVQKAKKTMSEAKKTGISIEVNGEVRTIDMEVFPIQEPGSKYVAFLILLEDSQSIQRQPDLVSATRMAGKPDSRGRLISKLKREITEMKQETRAVVEEMEHLNQEVTASNEELQSANEELQSFNEELETAKEQLESSNEELATLNAELETRNIDLDNLNARVRESRDFSEAIIGTIREPLVIVDNRLRVRKANEAFLRMFNYVSSEVRDAQLLDLSNRLWDIPSLRNGFESILSGQLSELNDFEVEQKTEGIGHKILLINARRIEQQGGRGVLILIAIDDVTHRKHSEKASVTMLREIHHRVKNNLQVVNSLLSLQCQSLKDSEAITAISETENRVRSIALTHEKLYESKEIGRISFDDYISDLADHLIHFYGRQAEHVSLRQEVKNIHLNMDQAIPCGLIINELLSNALKYAFPDRRKGVVTISIKQQIGQGQKGVNGFYLLTVSDNGVGLPQGFSLENPSSMGLQIVYSLANQLAGEIKVDREGGTTFQITFPVFTR